jgi:hypothetical protein
MKLVNWGCANNTSGYGDNDTNKGEKQKGTSTQQFAVHLCLKLI